MSTSTTAPANFLRHFFHNCPQSLEFKMANFWDLPKHVRERIYRLHLVYDEPITPDEHDHLVKYDSSQTYAAKTSREPKYMPPVFHISTKAEKEVAPIYYGENHFELSRALYHV